MPGKAGWAKVCVDSSIRDDCFWRDLANTTEVAGIVVAVAGAAHGESGQ